MIPVALFAAATVVVAALAYGAWRWRVETRAIHAVLESARTAMEPATWDPAEIAALPAPVQRYFRAVLKEGQLLIAAVTVEHAGTFRTSESAERWQPFTSTQRVITGRPGFDWEARIRMAPGLAVKVHDAYVAGEGILHTSLFGLITLAEMRGTPDVAEGELFRYLAEAAWYPTALLPGRGVRWEAVDDTSARASLQDGRTVVSLLFRFREDGLIESARADARGRAVGGRVIPTPWEGRWSRYEVRDGMLIPIEGEVAWLLPEGPLPYWRGRIVRIDFEHAR